MIVYILWLIGWTLAGIFKKDGGCGIANFIKQLSLVPNIYACIAGQLLLSNLYNYLLSLLWILFIYQSFSLPEFKISKQWRPGLSFCVTFSNSQHWKPNTSITELQGFLGTIVAYSAGDACGTFLSGIAKLNYTSCVVSWWATFSFLTLKNKQVLNYS